MSDRGVQQDNEFQTYLYRIQKIKKKILTIQYPETDKQTEITNQELERYLRTFCLYQQDNQDEQLIKAEVAINGHSSKSTYLSLFFATNGFKPLNSFDLNVDKSLLLTSTKGNQDRNRALKFAKDTKVRSEFYKEQIILTQSRIEEHTNRSRTLALVYKPGDKVWLNLKNVRTQRPTKKLDDKNV